MFHNWSSKDEIETNIRTFQSVRDEIENTFLQIEWGGDENGENLYNITIRMVCKTYMQYIQSRTFMHITTFSLFISFSSFPLIKLMLSLFLLVQAAIPVKLCLWWRSPELSP